jgi:hypothetical protein
MHSLFLFVLSRYSSSSSLSKKKENSGFLVVVFGYVTCFIAVGSAVGAVVGGIIGAIKGTSAKKVRTKEMQVVMNAIGFPECPDCKKYTILYYA